MVNKSDSRHSQKSSNFLTGFTPFSLAKALQRLLISAGVPMKAWEPIFVAASISVKSIIILLHHFPKNVTTPKTSISNYKVNYKHYPRLSSSQASLTSTPGWNVLFAQRIAALAINNSAAVNSPICKRNSSAFMSGSKGVERFAG